MTGGWQSFNALTCVLYTNLACAQSEEGPGGQGQLHSGRQDFYGDFLDRAKAPPARPEAALGKSLECLPSPSNVLVACGCSGDAGNQAWVVGVGFYMSWPYVKPRGCY